MFLSKLTSILTPARAAVLAMPVAVLSLSGFSAIIDVQLYLEGDWCSSDNDGVYANFDAIGGASIEYDDGITQYSSYDVVELDGSGNFTVRLNDLGWMVYGSDSSMDIEVAGEFVAVNPC